MSKLHITPPAHLRGPMWWLAVIYLTVRSEAERHRTHKWKPKIVLSQEKRLLKKDTTYSMTQQMYVMDVTFALNATLTTLFKTQICPSLTFVSLQIVYVYLE